MATYEYSYNAAVSGYQYKLLDHQMYGMGRVGTYNVNEVLGNSQTQDSPANEPAKQFFEITDHLGSVRAVVSGVKKADGNADIVQLTDYHEFGQKMQGRSFVSQDYRFGYQGSEKDKEVNGGAYTTDFRALDVRLGRWMSPDKIRHPSWSPYVSMNDNPIRLTDAMGLESGDPPCGGSAPDPTTPDPYAGGDPDVNSGGSGGGAGGWTPGANMSVVFDRGSVAGMSDKANFALQRQNNLIKEGTGGSWKSMSVQEDANITDGVLTYTRTVSGVTNENKKIISIVSITLNKSVVQPGITLNQTPDMEFGQWQPLGPTEPKINEAMLDYYEERELNPGESSKLLEALVYENSFMGLNNDIFESIAKYFPDPPGYVLSFFSKAAKTFAGIGGVLAAIQTTSDLYYFGPTLKVVTKGVIALTNAAAAIAIAVDAVEIGVVTTISIAIAEIVYDTLDIIGKIDEWLEKLEKRLGDKVRYLSPLLKPAPL